MEVSSYTVKLIYILDSNMIRVTV